MLAAGARPKETKINLMDCIYMCSEVEIISGLPFSLNILLVFETLPSQRNIMFSLFNQLFLHDSLLFLAVFLWFLSHFSPLVS